MSAYPDIPQHLLNLVAIDLLGNPDIELSPTQLRGIGDAVIRVLAYHRRDKDRKVISFRSIEHDHVKNIIGEPFQPRVKICFPTPASLGRLEILPAELVLSVVDNLDIKSLFKLSHVNCRARMLVRGLSKWRAIATYALDALLALFRTGMAKHTTLAQLYRPLTEKWCTSCGEYGGFLFILTSTRYCLNCILDPVLFPVVTLNSVARGYKIPLKLLRGKVPAVKTIPGYYGTYELANMQRGTYVSFQHALEALEQMNGPESPDVEGFIENVYTTLHLAPFGSEPKDKCRTTTIIPTYDPATDTAYWGLSCKGCAAAGMKKLGRVRPTADLPDEIDKIYSREEFLGHFKVCKKAQEMWKASKGGRKSIVHLESRFSINGGFNSARMVPDGAWAY